MSEKSSVKDKILNDNTINESVSNVKNYIKEMPKKKKITIGSIIGGLILLAVILAVVMNMDKMSYKVLYENLESSESNAIYQALKESGVKAELNSQGQVIVPKGDYDTCLLQMAAKGYPQSALTYDIFESHSGLTSTESDKKQVLIYQLQDRLQSTLSRIDGVNGATITITMPESSDYVWEQATTESEHATAGVLLSFATGKSLSDEQITAVQNLVASSVPKMEPEDVTIVDAKTMLELTSDNSSNPSVDASKNLSFEQTVQNQIEDNIVRVLTPKYGKSGVVAVAKVTINYDKMMTEKMELLANQNGDGFLTHAEGENLGSDTNGANGIVGEENNTDIPDYTYQQGTNATGDSAIVGVRDYDYGYIKTQVESGNAVLDRATVSVMVKQSVLTAAAREEIVNIVSKSTDIAPEFIYVSSFSGASENSDVPAISDNAQNIFTMLPSWAYFVIAAAVLLIIIIVFVVIAIIKKKKKKRNSKMDDYYQELEENRKAEQLKMQQEIEEYKDQLANVAKSKSDPKDDAILKEVRKFANDNPEITANLLRSWLKEGE